ncbi:MAG: BamA/TamA family outer membrane protein [bacterium]|nr:BamA/TamA family outer membrane protein [bacterium]
MDNSTTRKRVPRTRNSKLIIGGICLFLLLAQPVIGQDFGKNRVRYKDFTWKIASTKHFDIYFQPGTENLAAKAAEFAEEAYRKASQDFDYKVSRTIPLIIFPSHADFRQTNVILEFIDRGVGGFAEIFKFRIVIPFTGSYSKLQYVITHELTHIFTYDILYRDVLSSLFSSRMITPPPLWLMEGIAEYATGEMDSEGEAVLRNAVISNELIPLNTMAGFLNYQGYKQSQSFVSYIAATYGPDKPALLIRKYRDSPNIEQVVKSTLGAPLPEIWEDWLRYVKKKYYPDVADKEPAKTYGKELIDKISLGAVWSAGGDIIAVITRHGYNKPGISLVRVEDGVEVDKFEFDELEEVNMEGTPLDWSSDGRFIVLLAGKKDRNYFLIWDVTGEKETERIYLDRLDSLSSPAWLGERLVFAGTKAGKSSLYLFDPSTTTLTQLTPDTFAALQPACSQDGEQIAFVKENGEARDIYLIELSSYPGDENLSSYDNPQSEIRNPKSEIQIRPLIQNGKQNIDPSWFPTGFPDGKRLLFASDMGGGYDIYEYNLESDQITRLTNCLSGAQAPQVSKDGKKLAFTTYSSGETVTYVGELDKLTKQKVERDTGQAAYSEMPVEEIEVDASFELKNYKTQLTLDYAQGNIIYNTSQGFSGFTEIAASDILGNHRFIFLTDYLSTISNLADLNFSLSYLYLAKRPVVGVGVFNWNDLRFFDEDEQLDDRRYGGVIYFAYPLDTFRRIEAELTSEFKREEFLAADNKIETRKEGADILGLSYVKDTTNWGVLSPVDGSRLELKVERTVPVFFRKRSFTNYLLDARKYIRLSARSAFAFRISGKISEGKDPDIFPMGGSWDMRASQYNKFWGSRAVLANLELRVPFIDRLDLAFPLPLSFRGISGVGFFDLGGVWNESEKPRLWNDHENRLGDKFHSAIGIGTRLTIGFLPVRLDWAFPTDLDKVDKKSIFHFSLGYDF